MDNILEKLIVAGYNVSDALDRFLNDKSLYIDCVIMFSVDENIPKLKEAMEAKDYKEAFKYVHTIKGVAGNLGLDAIYDAAHTLTEDLRNDIKPETERDYNDFLEAWEDYIYIVKGKKD